MFPLADTGRPDAEGITYTHIHGSAHWRARPISTHIVSNLCNAMQFLVRRHKFNAACGFQQAGACVNWVESRSSAIFLFEHDFSENRRPLFRVTRLRRRQIFANAGGLSLRLRRVHGGLADELAHFADLLRQRAHLRLHIFAVHPHHLGQILGFQQ